VKKFNLESFETKFDKVDGCWEWKAYKNQDGYGRIRRNRRLENAHRVSYELYIGPPGDLHVLHKCDNPSCVNPDHLFLGTDQDNMTDKRYKGRGGTNKLTEDEVRLIRADVRLHREIATTYGVTIPLISMIKRNKIWKHLT
jgi:HNH endonuclease